LNEERVWCRSPLPLPLSLFTLGFLYADHPDIVTRLSVQGIHQQSQPTTRMNQTTRCYKGIPPNTTPVGMSPAADTSIGTEYWTISTGVAVRNGWSCRDCRQDIQKGGFVNLTPCEGERKSLGSVVPYLHKADWSIPIMYDIRAGENICVRDGRKLRLFYHER